MKIRKELWFGFVLMALIVAAAIGMLLSVEKVTNGHIGLLMLSLVAVANTAQVTSVATASEPGTRAIDRCRLLNSFSIRLARSTR